MKDDSERISGSLFRRSTAGCGWNKKSCDSGTLFDLFSPWIGRSFSLLKMVSAASMTTVSVDVVDEAGECGLESTISSMLGR